MANLCRRSQPIVSNTIPRQVDLSCIKKVAEQVRESKPANSIPPDPHLLGIQLLSWVPSVMGLRSPSLPMLLLVSMIYDSSREQKEANHKGSKTLGLLLKMSCSDHTFKKTFLITFVVIAFLDTQSHHCLAFL